MSSDLRAGRELDELVDRVVFRIIRPEPLTPAYSTRIEEAWRVLEQLRREGWAYTIQAVPSISSVFPGFRVLLARSVYPPGAERTKPEAVGEGPNPAEAICRAALRVPRPVCGAEEQ